jgi:hypothetical protein
VAGIGSFSGTTSSPTAFSGSAGFSGLNTIPSFTLMNEVKITQQGNGATSFDVATTVPEPVTLGLLGLGLLGLGFARRRFAA